MSATGSPWDLLLVGVVSVQVTLVAYLPAPRWKAVVLCLPFPFTVVALGLGRPIDTTNLLGLPVILLYVHGVRLLHHRLRLPIVPAIALAVLGYCLVSWLAVRWLPMAPQGFWIWGAALCLLALLLHLRLAPRAERAHRTMLPIWLKLPVVVGVVCLLVAIKESLQGFATLFPMVSVVGAYESRHSLWTFGRYMPVLMLTMAPMMAVARLSQGTLGLGGGLALGWCAFLAVFIPLLRHMWAAEEAISGGQRPAAASPVGPARGATQPAD
ncbi:MAG: hypothetical protein AB1505_09705 [Candidatus Latescibacterota bacterium]